MENVVTSDAAKLEERQSSENEVFKPSGEDNVTLDLDELKESEKDETFEDAVEAETPEVYLDNGGMAKDGNADSCETPDSNPIEGLNTESDIRAEVLMNAKHPDEKQSSMEKVANDEKNGTMYNGHAEDEKVGLMELADSSADESNFCGGKEKERLLNSPQSAKDTIADSSTSFQKWTSGDAYGVDADRREHNELQTSETPEHNYLRGVETNLETPDVNGNFHKKSDIQDANEMKGGGSIGLEAFDTGTVADPMFLDSLNHGDSKIPVSDTTNALTHETSAESDDANGSEGSVDRPEPEANGDILHDNKPMINTNGPVAITDSDYQHEQNGSALTNLLNELKYDRAKPQYEESVSSCANLRDDVNDRQKEVDPEHIKVGMAGVPRHVNASSRTPSPVVEETEKVGVEPEKKENNSSENGVQEKTSGHVIFSSSGDSTSDITRVHPVSHKPTVPVHGGVSQGNLASKEQNANVAVISSKKSVNPKPAGSGHAAPLVEPVSSGSGKKESGSRSAADIPPATSNIAAGRPAGLGRAAPLLEPTSRVLQQPRVNGIGSPMQNQLVEDPTNGETEEYDETREKLQMIRVKFLRLAHRLGQTPHNVVVAQVLYRLGLAEQLQGRSGSRVAGFSFDRASAMAEQLEAAGQEQLDFTCTVMVLGKTGVGKSATINSIFDEVMFGTDAFQLGTKKVQDIVGTVQGIRVRVIDTPGLLPSWSDQCQNEKILRSVKKFIKASPPDIVLYLDRLDMQSRDFGDMLLLRTITEIFGPSIWFNAIVVLTHAASAPPEGPNGTTTSYDMFVTQRSHVVQQAIRQAAGDMRLMNPVSLVENHSACRTNRAGQRVLPNGQVWKPHLLLLSFASKILAEANTLLKLQDGPPGKSFAPRARSPPLPFLLSSLLQSRPEIKLPSEQFGDDDDAMDDDLDESSESDDELEYDELPSFTSLTKEQLQKLNKMQRKAYYDELEYREKLFMKKQLKEEKKRRMMAKKILEEAKNSPVDYGENAEEEASSAASVPVPMPDLALPASFDSDNPTHRYRSLDSSNPWLVRAVLEPNGWDHDIGYDGINAERLFVIQDQIPISFSGHLSKDKKDGNIQMEIASSVKHGKGKSTSLGFDMQSIGKDFAYTLRTETRLSNHQINKATAGFSATLLGDVLTGGLKVEDKLLFGKRGQLVVSGGAMVGRGDVAYGGSLEATLRDKDHPLGRFLSTLGISVMDWHGDLAIGSNFQTQIPVGHHTNLTGRLNINNKGSGQLSVRVNSSEQLQIILIGLVPLAKKLLGFSQPVQYG